MPKYYRFGQNFEYSFRGNPNDLDSGKPPQPFVITMSGGTNVGKPGGHDDSVFDPDNGRIVVAVKMFNLWKNLGELKKFLLYLLRTYQVQNSKFVLHGHSNGGGGMLTFACLHPELCCGLVLFAPCSGPINRALRSRRIDNLRGIPVALHYDPKDEKGFGPGTKRLATWLNSHSPWAESSVWKGHGVKALCGGAGRRKVLNQIARMFSTSPVSLPSTSPVASAGQGAGMGGLGGPGGEGEEGDDEDAELRAALAASSAESARAAGHAAAQDDEDDEDVEMARAIASSLQTAEWRYGGQTTWAVGGEVGSSSGAGPAEKEARQRGDRLLGGGYPGEAYHEEEGAWAPPTVQSSPPVQSRKRKVVGSEHEGAKAPCGF